MVQVQGKYDGLNEDPGQDQEEHHPRVGRQVPEADQPDHQGNQDREQGDVTEYKVDIIIGSHTCPKVTKKGGY